MGIRSDVGIAIKHSLYNILSAASKTLLDEADHKEDHVQGRLFVFHDIKWYTSSDDELVDFYKDLSFPKLLKKQIDSDYDSDEDYIIVDACHDYPESTDGDAGSWHDNPWDLSKSVSASLNY